MKKLTIEQIAARDEAYEQAIGSLQGNWTDDPVEREQGNILAEKLCQELLMWHRPRWKAAKSCRSQDVQTAD